MSSYSYSQQCPHCYAKDSLMCQSSDLPSIDGICVECGYGYQTVHEIYDLKDVNNERENQDLPPYKALSKHEGMKHYIGGFNAEVPN